MLNFIIRRVFFAIIVLLGVSIITFVIVALIPGDPAVVLLGIHATEESLAAVRESFRLDQPLLVRYFSWLIQVLQGNLGISSSSGQPVLYVLKSSLGATLMLATISTILALLISIPLGIISAVKQGTTTEHLLSVVAITGLSMPDFWVGIVFIMLFSVRLGWFPPSGYVSMIDDFFLSLKYAALPAIAASWRLTASLTRFVRSSMLQAINNQYITTALAKGLSDSTVIIKHCLRNALIPVVTITGLQFGSMLGGLIVIETMFAWPGLGRLAVQAIGFRDYALLQGVILIFAAVFSILNLLVDLSYGFLDPRIRYE
jgi:peptide/nickel transport system permease protein